ncbi:MAG TPA: hypothetical protein VHB97_19175 [Polyangia bacterium]|nr:hypothetical protein [Polyangia bacterium]
MRRILGLALAGVIGGACGHEITTGSARNDWATPTGHASATNPRYINPLAATHPARNRSVFAERQAPPLQPGTTSDVTTPVPTVTPIAPDLAAPPVPDIAVPDVSPRTYDQLPPYTTPPRP